MAVVATRWTAGENRLRAILTDPTVPGTASTGPGPMGTDIGYSVDLAPLRPNCSAWFFGDTSYSTAAGQTKAATTLIKNAIMFQQGRDLTTATLSWHVGGSQAVPTPYFAPRDRRGMAFGKYPFGAVLLDDRLLVVGQASRGLTDMDPAGVIGNFGTTMMGSWATMLHGVGAGTPDNWLQRELPVGMPGDSYHQKPTHTFISNPIDAGDGFVYFPCTGPSGSNVMSMCRTTRALAKAGDLTKLEWWDGAGRWRQDTINERTGAVRRHRANILGFSLDGSDQAGGIAKRPDGQWQLTVVKEGWRDAASVPTVLRTQAPHVRASVAAQIQGPYPAPTDVYAITPQTSKDFFYGGLLLPEQSWSGKGASDQLIVYSRNFMSDVGLENLGAFNDVTKYWPELIKVSGL